MKKVLVIVCSLLVSAICIYIVIPTSTLFQVIIGAERSIAGLEVKTLKTDSFEIEYLHGGSGRPLILLHGFGADKDNWNRISGYLNNNFEIIAIDLPGFGNSTSELDIDYDVLSQTLRLKKIVDALELTEFDLAGSSMGGYIAGNFATQFPENVRNLWLISPFGIVDSETSEMFAAVKNGQNPAVLPRTEAEFTKLFDFLFVEPPFIPKPIIKHLALESEERVQLNTKIFEQIHRMKNREPTPDFPLERTLKGYKGSVLVLWGNNDRVLHVSGARALKKVLPQAKIEIIDNIGHLPMLENPKATAEAFLSFTGVP